ncbi:hypothetical protein Tco_1526956 [Tanacetum coccineum]
MDAQYKELQNHAKKTKLDLDEDDIPILADKQSGRPSGSLPSNTQPNLKGHNSKVYQQPQSRNEHVHAVFTRSDKSYNPPVNSNDQQTNPENPINVDNSDEEDCNTPKIGRSRNDVPGALLHNTIAQVMRERPLSVV